VATEGWDKKDNLRPYNLMSKEEARVFQAKGGRGKEGTSIKKSVSAQIAILKKKGIGNPSIQLMLDMMDNPNVSNFQILSLIQEFKEALALEGEFKPQHYAMLAKMYLEWHKIVHGEKHKVEHTGTMDIVLRMQNAYDRARNNTGSGTMDIQ
jgi:hypothetical protein